MILLVTADWQLSPNPRDAYRFTNLVQLADIIEQHKVDNLVILGDLTEEKNYHSDRLVNDITELLYNFSCLCPVYILRGNHDAASFDLAYFQFLRHIPNIRWIDYRARALDDCLFLPFTHQPEKDWTPDLFKPLPRWIFAHHTFAEVETESGFHLRGTPLTILPIGAHVISGDIHTPQHIGDSQRSVTYVGAPYTVDFGDNFEPRVLLVKGEELTSIPMTGPQKRLITMSTKPWKQQLNPRDIVKICYQLTTAEHEYWPEIKANIRKQFEDLGCQVFAILPIAPPAAALAARMRPTPRSDEELIRSFATRQRISPPTLEAGLNIVKAL